LDGSYGNFQNEYYDDRDDDIVEYYPENANMFDGRNI